MVAQNFAGTFSSIVALACLFHVLPRNIVINDYLIMMDVLVQFQLKKKTESSSSFSSHFDNNIY